MPLLRPSDNPLFLLAFPQGRINARGEAERWEEPGDRQRVSSALTLPTDARRRSPFGLKEEPPAQPPAATSWLRYVWTRNETKQEKAEVI